MVEDARFEDGGEKPISLKALDAEDLTVISALAQDAVVPMGEISYDATQRRFAMLINRFRWEDVDVAARRRRPVERVQAVLVFDDVMAARAQGVPRRRKGDGSLPLGCQFCAHRGWDGNGRNHSCW